MVYIIALIFYASEMIYTCGFLLSLFLVHCCTGALNFISFSIISKQFLLKLVKLKGMVSAYIKEDNMRIMYTESLVDEQVL